MIARSVIAVDIDAALLEAAKVRIAKRGGAHNCTFVEADAYNLAMVVPAPVDHVFLANSFQQSSGLGFSRAPQPLQSSKNWQASVGIDSAAAWTYQTSLI